MTKVKILITFENRDETGVPGMIGRVRGKGSNGNGCRGPRAIKIFDVAGGTSSPASPTTSDGSTFTYKKATAGRRYQAVAPKYKTSGALCRRAVSKTVKSDG